MVVTKHYATLDDGRELVVNYSDKYMWIISDETGQKHGSPIDPADMHRTYTESDEELPQEEKDIIDNLFPDPTKVVEEVIEEPKDEVVPSDEGEEPTEEEAVVSES